MDSNGGAGVSGSPFAIRNEKGGLIHVEHNYLLQMKDIRIAFGALVANDNVNFNLKKGTVHALIGENGAGKSTLMNILTGIYRPDHGDIILNGKKVVFKNSLDAAKCGIGMVYQAVSYTHLTLPTT